MLTSICKPTPFCFIGYQIPSPNHQNTKTNAPPTNPANAIHDIFLPTTAEDLFAPPFALPVPFTGAVVAAVKITSVVPDIIVVFPFNGTLGSTGTVVGPEKISYSDPDMTVIRPGNVSVGLVVDGGGVDSGIVVGPDRTRYGVPLIVVVEPCRPAGAPDSGIVVADG
jgi:hypothetical protein